MRAQRRIGSGSDHWCRPQICRRRSRAPRQDEPILGMSLGTNGLAVRPQSMLRGDQEGGVGLVIAETTQLNHNIGGFGDPGAFDNTTSFRPTWRLVSRGLYLESQGHWQMRACEHRL